MNKPACPSCGNDDPSLIDELNLTAQSNRRAFYCMVCGKEYYEDIPQEVQQRQLGRDR